LSFTFAHFAIVTSLRILFLTSCGVIHTNIDWFEQVFLKFQDLGSDGGCKLARSLKSQNDASGRRRAPFSNHCRKIPKINQCCPNANALHIFSHW